MTISNLLWPLGTFGASSATVNGIAPDVMFVQSSAGRGARPSGGNKVKRKEEDVVGPS